MRIELKDLPTRMQRQALKIMAEEDERKSARASPKKPADKSRFDSKGEAEFYLGVITPGLRSGEIVSCEEHPEFKLYDAAEFCGLKLGTIRYTADFKLTYKNGTVEVIEIKSKFVRKMQRDYPVRRRAFIEQYARPNGWIFKEIITDKN